MNQIEYKSSRLSAPRRLPGLGIWRIFPIILLACQPHGAGAAPLSSEWDDLARYFAGLELRAESPLAPLQQERAYQNYRRNQDQLWTRIMQRSGAPIDSWRNSNAPPQPASSALYFFSGADAFNLLRWYPDARRYVMVSLEEPGKIPDPRELNAAQRQSALARLHNSIVSLGQDNYLRTLVMRAQLADNRFRGLLAVLLLELARSGCRIESVTRVALDSNGELQPADAETAPLTPEQLQQRLRDPDYAPEGLRIRFIREGESNQRELAYLRLWISDELLTPQTRSAKFLEGLGAFSYLLKSASYHLHRTQDERLARFLAQRAVSGIQDDSGVPYRYLIQAGRRVRLFGAYRSATRLRDQPFTPDQPDLRAAYAAEARPALPFSYGYGALHGHSNIQTTERPDQN